MHWHTLTIPRTIAECSTTPDGLSDDDASARLKHTGPNDIPRKKPTTAATIVLNQFRSSMVYILLGAAAISFVIGEMVDFGIILSAVVLNVIVGFLQEYRADRALAALRKAVTFETIVLRNGKERQIDVMKLVPGDIVRLTAGSNVPADCRIIEAHELRINEAGLTGESKPIIKQTKTLADPTLVTADRMNMAYMGTSVIGGKGTGVIVATGLKTEYGKIARMIQETPEDDTALQKKLRSFSRVLGIIILIVAAALFVIGIAVGQNLKDMFLTSVAVAVAAIPEGLIIAVTVILTIGMRRILKKQALVRKLIAAETLGSTSVICTDKTGTLTEGDMHVVRVITNNHSLPFNPTTFAQRVKEVGDAASFLLVHRIGVLCNDATIENEASDTDKWVIIGNPTERALLLAGSHLGLRRSELEKETPRLSTIPFSSERKFMVTLHAFPKRNMLYLKGAPERVLAMCTGVDLDGNHSRMSAQTRATLESRYQKASAAGLRMIALAMKTVPKSVERLTAKTELSGCTFVGFMGIKDPLRDGVVEALQETKKAGIRTVMITGDHRLTAQAIARELKLPAKPENILEGSELATMSTTELQKRITSISVFARVTPHDKLRIIDAWQHRGRIVAMTGDGVNDAPAIRSANIGIALGDGTDIAKETADMVLLNNHFATIVRAVREGRVVFDNIRKVILYLLSDSFSEIIILSGAIILGMPLPLTAAQILWINIITDDFPNIAMTLEPAEDDVMKEKPRKPETPIVNAEMKTLIAIISGLTGLVTLGIFSYFWHTTGNLELARTIAFVSLGFDSLLYVFSIRSMRHSIFKTNPFSNKWLLLAVVVGLIIQLFALYLPALETVLETHPLTIVHWSVLVGSVFFLMAIIEITKAVFLGRFRRARHV